MSRSNTRPIGTASRCRRRLATPQITDEGCTCDTAGFGLRYWRHVAGGGGGVRSRATRSDVDVAQVGASVMHVPSGLWVYGLYQNEHNDGTPYQSDQLQHEQHRQIADANDTDVWFIKAGIKRTWTPLGATVLWGEGGQYQDQFGGLCGLAPVNYRLGHGSTTSALPVNPRVPSIRAASRSITTVTITSSTVNRWGSASCRRSTRPPCMCRPLAASGARCHRCHRRAATTVTAFGHRQPHNPAYRRSGPVPGRWRDLLLSHKPGTTQNGSRPSGRLLFCARVAGGRAQTGLNPSPEPGHDEQIKCGRSRRSEGCRRGVSGAISWASGHASFGKALRP